MAKIVAVQPHGRCPKWKAGRAEKEEAEGKPEVSSSEAQWRARIQVKSRKWKNILETHENG